MAPDEITGISKYSLSGRKTGKDVCSTPWIYKVPFPGIGFNDIFQEKDLTYLLFNLFKVFLIATSNKIPRTVYKNE